MHHNKGWGIHIYTTGTWGANNNTVINNRAYFNGRSDTRGWGIILSSGKNNSAINNIVFGNLGGIEVDYGAVSSSVYNNVVYNNSAYGLYVGAEANYSTVKNNVEYANPFWAFSMVGPSTVNATNLVDNDPVFIDPQNWDFRLQDGSPAIDAGTFLPEVPRDFAGVARPQRAGSDIGAFEKV